MNGNHSDTLSITNNPDSRSATVFISSASFPSATDSANVYARISVSSPYDSVFRLVGTAPEVNLARFRVAPNPFRPNDGDASNGQNFTGADGTGIYFLNLPARVRIQVYSVLGAKVFDFTTQSSTGQVQWDVKNENRADVASGVYLYIVTDLATNQRVTGRLSVIR